MKTILDHIERALSKFKDPQKAAKSIISLLSEDEIRFAAENYIARKFTDKYTQHRKEAQDSFLDAYQRSDATEDERLTARRKLGRERVYDPDTGMSTYYEIGQMTAEQHDVKAKWHMSAASGHNKTAKMHQIAAKEIRNADVTCLNDLGITEKELLTMV